VARVVGELDVAQLAQEVGAVAAVTRALARGRAAPSEAQVLSALVVLAAQRAELVSAHVGGAAHEVHAGGGALGDAALGRGALGVGEALRGGLGLAQVDGAGGAASGRDHGGLADVGAVHGAVVGAL